jgi:hypothetical protein
MAATAYPFSFNLTLIAAPIPLLPPVTIATRPIDIYSNLSPLEEFAVDPL